jgi:hypothetical protein
LEEVAGKEKPAPLSPRLQSETLWNHGFNRVPVFFSASAIHFVAQVAIQE